MRLGRNPSLQVRRRALLALIVSAPASAAWATSCAPRRVLFVCPAGTVKSPIAREMARRISVERGVPLLVSARGVALEDHLGPALAARLRADGIDPGREPARALSAADLAQADIIVAFDEASRAPGLAGARNWNTPSWNTDYDRARAVVTERIEALLDELAVAACR